MSLAAVMGLMIEKMVEGGGERLLDVLRINNGPVMDRLVEVVIPQAADVAGDERIFRAPRGA